MLEAPQEVSVQLTLTQSEVRAIRTLSPDLNQKMARAIHEATMPVVVHTKVGYVVRDATRIYGRFPEGPQAYAKAFDLLHRVKAWLDEAPTEGLPPCRPDL